MKIKKYIPILSVSFIFLILFLVILFTDLKLSHDFRFYTDNGFVDWNISPDEVFGKFDINKSDSVFYDTGEIFYVERSGTCYLVENYIFGKDKKLEGKLFIIFDEDDKLSSIVFQKEGANASVLKELVDPIYGEGLYQNGSNAFITWKDITKIRIEISRLNGFNTIRFYR